MAFGINPLHLRNTQPDQIQHQHRGQLNIDHPVFAELKFPGYRMMFVGVGDPYGAHGLFKRRTARSCNAADAFFVLRKR